MSIEGAPNYEPTTAEIDDIFGDGTIKISRPLWHYIVGAMIRPNSVASEFSEDAELYRKAWILVVLATFVSLAGGYFAERAFNAQGISSDAEFRVNFILVGYTSLSLLFGYPLLRAVFVFLFRQGSGYLDRRVCAASALIVGCEIFLDPLLQLMTLALANLELTGKMIGETAYERATFLPSLLYSGISTWYCFCYVRDAFGVHNGRAFWTIVLAFLVLTVIAIVPLVFVEMLFPEWSMWNPPADIEGALSE